MLSDKKTISNQQAVALMYEAGRDAKDIEQDPVLEV
jgi:hypothetical protein